MASPSPEALAVLAFWFDPANHGEWFAINPQFDKAIREQFGDVLAQAAKGELADWSATPSGWLALLIVLDQFSRNLYRRDPRAWQQDRRAQQLALWGIEEGFDRQLLPIQRVFAYMPLEHAEDKGLQQRCVELFESLCGDVPPDEHDRYTEFLDYAQHHQAVIARFGRFPHRNAVLGRTNTQEESAYLSDSDAHS